MRTPESTPWLSKAGSKSTPTIWFTKHRKLTYAFHKLKYPFGEHYQTKLGWNGSTWWFVGDFFILGCGPAHGYIRFSGLVSYPSYFIFTLRFHSRFHTHNIAVCLPLPLFFSVPLLLFFLNLSNNHRTRTTTISLNLSLPLHPQSFSWPESTMRKQPGDSRSTRWKTSGRWTPSATKRHGSGQQKWSNLWFEFYILFDYQHCSFLVLEYCDFFLYWIIFIFDFILLNY